MGMKPVGGTRAMVIDGQIVGVIIMKIKFQVLRVDSRGDHRLEKDFETLEQAEAKAEEMATAAVDLLGNVEFTVRKVWSNERTT
jgi:hypothetical protein